MENKTKIICQSCFCGSSLNDWNTATKEKFKANITPLTEKCFGENGRVKEKSSPSNHYYICPKCAASQAGIWLRKEGVNNGRE